MRTLALALTVTLGCAGMRQSTCEAERRFNYLGSSVERVSVSAKSVSVAIDERVFAFEHDADGQYFTGELPYRTFDTWQGAARAIVDMNHIGPETAER